MISDNITALIAISILVLTVYFIGRIFERSRQQPLLDEQTKRCDRYVHAIDELDLYCSHSVHALLILRYLKAVSEGRPLNTGVPKGNEACDISGLREQLRRLDAIKHRS